MSEFTPSGAWGLSSDLAHDVTNLYALIVTYAARQDVPCISGSGCPTTYWTSDQPSERERAAKECARCPVVTQCQAYRMRHPDEWGIYGGLDRQRRKAGKK